MISDGIYPGMSRAEYHAIKAVNQSLLKQFARSAAHAREYMMHPPEPTEAMDDGNAIHCAVLEPKRFADTYVVSPRFDRRLKADKEAWAEFEKNNAGKEIIDEDTMLMCRAITENCYADPVINRILAGKGHSELCVVWTDVETGLRCKALLDCVVKFQGFTFIVDLKSTKDASPEAFGKQCANLGYHEQAAFYLEGLNTIAPMERRFLHLAVEKVRPFCAAVYELQDDSINAGRFEFRAHLNQYAECLRTNVWPGYPSGITPLNIPVWAMSREEVTYA